MAPTVNLQAVVDEMGMAGDEATAYVNRNTGDLFLLGEEDLSHAGDEDDDSHLPDWRMKSIADARKVLSDDSWIALPDQFEINEYKIMERFCISLEDERMQEILLRVISGKGAFQRFKRRIIEQDVRGDWFAFRDAALKTIAADFLQSQNIAYKDE